MSRMGKRVRVSTRHPRAAAVCDRCGLWVNHAALSPQMEFQGARLGRRGNLLVCARCLDRPNPQLRARVIRPDGLPIRDPRPEPYTADFIRGLSTESGVELGGEDGGMLIVDDLATDADVVAGDDGASITSDDGTNLDVNLDG